MEKSSCTSAATETFMLQAQNIFSSMCAGKMVLPSFWEKHILVSSLSVVFLGLLALAAQQHIIPAIILVASLGSSLAGSCELGSIRKNISLLGSMQILLAYFSLRRCFSIITITAITLITLHLFMFGNVFWGCLGVCAFISAIQHESFASDLSSLQEITSRLQNIEVYTNSLQKITDTLTQGHQQNTDQQTQLNQEHALLNTQQSEITHQISAEIRGITGLTARLEQIWKDTSSCLPDLLRTSVTQAEYLQKELKKGHEELTRMKQELKELNKAINLATCKLLQAVA